MTIQELLRIENRTEEQDKLLTELMIEEKIEYDCMYGGYEDD